MNRKKESSKAEDEVMDSTEMPDTDVKEEPTQSKEAELTAKYNEMNDKYIRLRAEFDNYQKRTLKEKDARYGDALIETVAKILPIGDNLERALQTEVASDDAKKLKEGVEMVLKQFKDALTALEVSEINALGEQFDPNYHNAVMHIEDETIDDNTVVDEFMKGYKYKDDRVIRHSMVKVAN